MAAFRCKSSKTRSIAGLPGNNQKAGQRAPRRRPRCHERSPVKDLEHKASGPQSIWVQCLKRVFQIDIKTCESHAFANPLCSTNLAPPILGPDPHNEPDPPFRSLSGLALAYCAYGKSALFPAAFLQTGPLFSSKHGKNGLDFPQCPLRPSKSDRLLAALPPRRCLPVNGIVQSVHYC